MMDVWRALLLLHAQNEKAPFGYLTRKVLEGVSGALQVCPHMYVSSYYYICVLILLYMCPHTADVCWRLLTYEGVSGALQVCPHTTIYVSSYCYICVLILLCMCPHTADVCWCMLTYADVCVAGVSSYYYVCVLIQLTYADVCWRMLTYALQVCPHTTIYVSS